MIKIFNTLMIAFLLSLTVPQFVQAGNPLISMAVDGVIDLAKLGGKIIGLEIGTDAVIARLDAEMNISGIYTKSIAVDIKTVSDIEALKSMCASMSCSEIDKIKLEHYER